MKFIFFMLLSFIIELDTLKLIEASINNEPCLIRPTLADLNFDELCGYPFMVNSDKCTGRCNTLDDIHESKALEKHISCDCWSR